MRQTISEVKIPNDCVKRIIGPQGTVIKEVNIGKLGLIFKKINEFGVIGLLESDPEFLGSGSSYHTNFSTSLL
jgi:hypothetical protein